MKYKDIFGIIVIVDISSKKKIVKRIDLLGLELEFAKESKPISKKYK